MAGEKKQAKAPAEKKAAGKAPAEKAEKAPAAKGPKPKVTARLRDHYTKNVIPALVKEFSYKNVNAVPKVEKVALNVGLGEATQNPKLMDGAVNEMTSIAGQKP